MAEHFDDMLALRPFFQRARSDLVVDRAHANGAAPSRADMDLRRESRLGLRGIFHRRGKSQDAPVERASESRSNKLRQSLADFGNWPYGAHARRPSSGPLPSASQTSLSSSSGHGLKHQLSLAGTLRAHGRNSTTAWHPPPLFQAYPQAVKYATLDACTSSAESVLRHSQRGSLSTLVDDVPAPTTSAFDLDDDEPTEPFSRARRRHKRSVTASSGFKLEWITKIYILVTSGYLLQYSSDGTFDRLPEKVLGLGKESAAFATDSIPGRHWVLQVSSVTDADGTHVAPSLLSRLPFRGFDRKQAANFLMVFRCPDDMDAWITILRRHIEAVGGKKNLSETGQPKTLISQPKRTLVVRDPDRFSYTCMAEEEAWDRSPVVPPGCGRSLDGSDDGARSRSLDGGSTTSGMSQDGRQLDGLRDSTNRLSYVSSGQRTLVTSAGSSPACSPLRETFDPPPAEDKHTVQHDTWGPPQTPKPRPNASAIQFRRQSNLHTNLWDASPCIQSMYSSLTPADECALSFALRTSPPSVPPNFSFPNASNTRFSWRGGLFDSAGPRDDSPSPSTTSSRVAPHRTARKPPPSALSINSRPLSFVQDFPSPMTPSCQMQCMTVPTTSPPATTTAELNMRPHTSSSPGENVARFERSLLPKRQSSLNARHVLAVLAGPRHMSLLDLDHRFTFPAVTTRPGASPPSVQDRQNRPSIAAQLERSEMLPTDAKDLPVPSNTAVARKATADRQAEVMKALRPTRSMVRLVHVHPPPSDLPTRSFSIARKPVANDRALPLRRSMSQLMDGPPPAPPPTRALPPIPKHLSEGETLPVHGIQI